MKITLNGKEKQMDSPCTIAELIESVRQKPQRIAVQLNTHIIKRDEYANHTLQDGDVIEMLHFVGGGATPSNRKAAS